MNPYNYGQSMNNNGYLLRQSHITLWQTDVNRLFCVSDETGSRQNMPGDFDTSGATAPITFSFPGHHIEAVTCISGTEMN